MEKKKIWYIILLGVVVLALVFVIFPRILGDGSESADMDGNVAEEAEKSGDTEADPLPEESVPEGGGQTSSGQGTAVPVIPEQPESENAPSGQEPEANVQISYINTGYLVFTDYKEAFQTACTEYLTDLGLTDVQMVVVLQNTTRLTDRYYYFEFQIDVDNAVFNVVYDSEDNAYDFALHSGAVTDIEARGGVLSQGDLIGKYRDKAVENAEVTGTGGSDPEQDRQEEQEVEP